MSSAKPERLSSFPTILERGQVLRTVRCWEGRAGHWGQYTGRSVQREARYISVAVVGDIKELVRRIDAHRIGIRAGTDREARN